MRRNDCKQLSNDFVSILSIKMEKMSGNNIYAIRLSHGSF